MFCLILHNVDENYTYKLLILLRYDALLCVISGLRRDVGEIFALQGCYAAYTGS